MAPLCSGLLCLLALPPDGRNQLQVDVSASRRLQQTGVVAGGGIAAVALTAGIVFDVLDPIPVLGCATILGCALVANTAGPSFNDNQYPLLDSEFVVQESEIQGAGMGLFAVNSIPSGTFLFDYKGERLSETEYFERYPDGQGRYVAEIPAAPWGGEPVYIDAANVNKSGLARWMNSRKDDDDDANVEWKKQTFGKGNMHFYAKRDISAGEELCFDYGHLYWGAVRD